MKSHFIVLSTLVVACLSQRSPYAGRDPIGYPKIEVTTSTTTTTAAPLNSLGNRFGNNATTITTTTTQKLPIEALGDHELVNRLSQLPVDYRPFWFLNAQALEEHRSRPHTFDLKPNVFNHNLGFPQQNAQIAPNPQINRFK